MSNWQPVLLRLVQDGRKVDAVKLWATVRSISLERAFHEMDDVFSLRRPFPTGDEYPDISSDILSFYESEPWRERGRTMTIIDLAQEIASRTGAHYRTYLIGLRRLYQEARIVTSGEWKASILSIDDHEVPGDCSGFLTRMRQVGVNLNELLTRAR